MSLEHILLGILKEPASGYDLRPVFERVFRHFWGADSSQIYRVLNRLEKQNKLDSWMEASDKGPDRRVYRTTDAGRADLLAWLQAGPVFGTEKFTYLAQIYFLGEVGDLKWSEAFFQSIRDDLKTSLDELRATEAGWSQNPDYPDNLSTIDFHRQLTLSMGLHKIAALVEWANESLSRIRQRQANEGQTND
ncbi:MAG: transcriptional regulator [Lysobacteraceae bacterium]|nr:MAG: transcriptional regulator [Xanthomonadaceae bacterium]